MLSHKRCHPNAGRPRFVVQGADSRFVIGGNVVNEQRETELNSDESTTLA
jgi:hypothetical protein